MVPYRIRKSLPLSIKNFLREVSYFLIFSDVDSLGKYRQMTNPKRREGAISEVLDLKIRQLRGQRIRIRTKGKDSEVVFDTFFHKFHLPPSDTVSRKQSVILDLGANIGCTTAHFACVFPKARILGVEMDSNNASLARVNTAAWSDRCRVIEGAVWPFDGKVQYEYNDTNQDDYTAIPCQSRHTECTRYAKAFSMTNIIGQHSPSHIIDYVKMDIEGGERDVLRSNTGWAEQVLCIKIELHGNYTKNDCIADLHKLGFDASIDRDHWNAVLGIRRI